MFEAFFPKLLKRAGLIRTRADDLVTFDAHLSEIEQSPKPSAHGTQRRRALLAAIGLWLAPWAPLGAQNAGQAAKQVSGGAKRFVAFSKLATGRVQLDPTLGATLFTALATRDRAFVSKLTALDELAQRRKITDVEALDAALQDNPLRADLLSIIAAWYTGSVGEGPQAKELTYAGALMYEPSADGSHNPGFCAGATNSWGSLPRPPIDVLPKT